jgi:glycosyltransferase involved in cell wall biosynthesis
MKIAIITRNLPPYPCGISDHTILLAKALEYEGHKVTIIAGRGQVDHNRLIIEDDWSSPGLSHLLTKLEQLDVDHIVLQYTPLMYSHNQGRQDFAFVKFWQACSQRWQTSIIIHETYFQLWTYPLSWWKGEIQKRLLKTLVDISYFVFTASQPLVDELISWGYAEKTTRLPLGSNFPFVPTNRDIFRQQHSIIPETVILTIFGGGTALKWKRDFVNKLDGYLLTQKIPVSWLFIGGVPLEWFTLSHPILNPGRLSEIEISQWLQISDIFLVPHQCGLNAKRSTVMAALQHGLPIVGTSGYMTDAFWTDLEGVTLVPVNNSHQWCKSVVNICNDVLLRQSHGSSNRDYYQNYLTWEKISNIFLEGIKEI